MIHVPAKLREDWDAVGRIIRPRPRCPVSDIPSLRNVVGVGGKLASVQRNRMF